MSDAAKCHRCHGSGMAPSPHVCSICFGTGMASQPARKRRWPLHPNDIAVDNFAAAMKAKLAEKRVEGRSGWQDKQDCSNAFLSRLLREHVAKGDPIDVANLAMMIHQRGERIETDDTAEFIQETEASIRRGARQSKGRFKL